MFDCGFDPATSGTEMQSTDNRKKKQTRNTMAVLSTDSIREKNQFRRRKGLRSDNSQRQTWVQGTNRGIKNISRVRFHVQTSEHIFFLQGACFDLTIPKDKLEHKQVDSTFRQVRTVFFGAVPKCWKYHKTLRFFSTERANEGSSLAADHGRKFNSNRKWVDVEYDWNFGLENQMKRKRIRTESGWM